MTRGLYISAIGMRTQMNKMDVLANNLANVDTSGFKKDATASRSFTEELMLRVHDDTRTLDSIQAGNGAYKHEREIGPLSGGVYVDEVYTDFSNGRLRAVSDPYSVGISGDGFFEISVQLATGEVATRYTRDGNFTLDSRGMLMTKDGGYVMGQNGPITLPSGEGETVIDPNGSISVGGQYVDTLRIVDFTDYTTLRKVGDNYYDVTEQTEQAAFTGTVAQGFVEDSNVNSVQEMVEIINTSRIYEANSRFVQVMDTILGKAVTEVGRK